MVDAASTQTVPTLREASNVLAGHSSVETDLIVGVSSTPCIALVC